MPSQDFFAFFIVRGKLTEKDFLDFFPVKILLPNRSKLFTENVCSESPMFANRVARWHIFKPKIPILVNFGGSCNGTCW
jgi:hypothetical protein